MKQFKKRRAIRFAVYTAIHIGIFLTLAHVEEFFILRAGTHSPTRMVVGILAFPVVSAERFLRTVLPVPPKALFAMLCLINSSLWGFLLTVLATRLERKGSTNTKMHTIVCRENAAHEV